MKQLWIIHVYFDIESLTRRQIKWINCTFYCKKKDFWALRNIKYQKNLHLIIYWNRLAWTYKLGSSVILVPFDNNNRSTHPFDNINRSTHPFDNINRSTHPPHRDGAIRRTASDVDVNKRNGKNNNSFTTDSRCDS